MQPTDITSAERVAEQARQTQAEAAERARYGEELAAALALDRLALVRHHHAPATWTITHRGQVIGEVTNDRPAAVLGGWMAHSLHGDPTGPHRTARAAAATLIPTVG